MAVKIVPLAFVLAYLAVVGQGVDLKKTVPKVCNGNNIRRLKCSFGKEDSPCLPRVTDVTYKWKEVHPTSFIFHWTKIASARCYYVEILREYTGFPYKVVSCYKGTTFKATGLKPWQVYGVRVSVLDQWCKKSQPSPSIIIRTIWAPVVPTAPTPRPIYSPKVGKCGRGFFTCKTNKKKCIPKRKYCDRIMQCEDGSDERKCPGGCKELRFDLKNGNYSCSRFGSPESRCFFDCTPPYVRDGMEHTECDKKRRRWTNRFPVCRLQHTTVFSVVPEKTTSTSVTVEWEPVEEASSYAFQAIEQANGHTTVSDSINSTLCCSHTISNLTPGSEYRITMMAFDNGGVQGMVSKPVFFKAVAPPKVVIKSGSG